MGLAHLAGGKLRSAFLVNLAARLASAVVALVLVPMYMRTAGPAIFGLVTLGAVCQTWIGVLDFGVASATARKLSVFRAGGIDRGQATSFVNAGEVFFAVAAVSLALAAKASADWMAIHWVRGAAADARIDLCLRWMLWTVILRWISGFYQNLLIGLECQSYSSVTALYGNVARAAAAWAVIALRRPLHEIFEFQCAVTLIEALLGRAYILAGRGMAFTDFRAGARALWSEKAFVISLFVSAAIGTLGGQFDKLILSHYLDIADYGAFGVVVALCSALAVFAPPVVQTVQAQMTIYESQNNRVALIDLYARSFIAFAVLLTALATGIALNAEGILNLWTGSPSLAVRMSALLSIYVFGTAINILLLIPYILQYAIGNLKYHNRFGLLIVVVQTAGTAFAAWRYGAMGTGVVWCLINLSALTLWIPLMHRLMLDQTVNRVIARAMAIIVAANALSAVVIKSVMNAFAGAMNVWAALAFSGLGVAMVALALILTQTRGASSLSASAHAA